MTDESADTLFSKYRYLVYWVASRRFGRVYTHGAGAVSYEDLLQEGNLALLEAARTYDKEHESGATFCTYAYQAIYKAMAHYLGAHGAPVTGQRAFNVRRGDEDLRAKCAAATKRILLDDLNFDSWEEALIDTTSPEEEVDTSDWVEFCLGQLAEKLDPEELAMLVLEGCGALHREIAETFGISRRTACRLVRQKLLKAAGILQEEMHP